MTDILFVISITVIALLVMYWLLTGNDTIVHLRAEAKANDKRRAALEDQLQHARQQVAVFTAEVRDGSQRRLMEAMEKEEIKSLLRDAFFVLDAVESWDVRGEALHRAWDECDRHPRWDEMMDAIATRLKVRRAYEQDRAYYERMLPLAMADRKAIREIDWKARDGTPPDRVHCACGYQWLTHAAFIRLPSGAEKIIARRPCARCGGVDRGKRLDTEPSR